MLLKPMLFMTYGTLKQFHSNNSLLSGATLVSPHVRTEDTFFMFNQGFPVTVDRDVESAHKLPVSGELYVINTPILNRLDQLEGYPSLFTRKQVEVIDLETYEHYRDVWIYLGNMWTKKEIHEYSCDFSYSESIKDPVFRWTGKEGVTIVEENYF